LNFNNVKSRNNFLGLRPSQLSPERQPNGQLSEKLAEENILVRADKALYKAKRTGRNKLVPG